MNSNNPLNPFWRVEIRTAAQARLYNRLLVAKIIVALVLLIGLLALSGWSLKAIAGGLAIAAVWKGTEMWLKRRRQATSTRT